MALSIFSQKGSRKGYNIMPLPLSRQLVIRSLGLYLLNLGREKETLTLG